MIQVRGGAGFLLESGEAVRIPRDLLGQNFQVQFASQARIFAR